MFLHTPMFHQEYMKVPFKYFPEDIMQRYDLYSKVHNGFIYIEIYKSNVWAQTGSSISI